MKRHTKVKSFARHLPFPWDGTSLSSALLLFISVVLMLISAIRPQLYGYLRSATADLFSAPLAVVSLPFQKVTIFFHDVTGFAQLQADKARLEKENERLREWYQMALLLDSENKSLRQLLSLPIDPKYDHIAGRVISDVGNTYVKSLLVVAGKEKGVQKGAAVLAGEGLIGRIVEVGDETSRILLITDINSRVPVVVEDTGHHAIMAGANDYNPRLIHVPQDSEITQGARIITSGYGGVYPHGLPVGRVMMNEQGALEVALFADFDALQIVRIIQKAPNIKRLQ